MGCLSEGTLLEKLAVTRGCSNQRGGDLHRGPTGVRAWPQCPSEHTSALFVLTCRSGSRTAGPNGGNGRSAGAEAASWRSTGSMGPWCDTLSPCQSPSSSPPRMASWTPVPRGCWVRARTLLGALPLWRGERAPWRRRQSPGAGRPGHSGLAGQRHSTAGLLVSLRRLRGQAGPRACCLSPAPPYRVARTLIPVRSLTVGSFFL